MTFHERTFYDENYNLFVFSEIIRKLKGIPFEIKSAQLQIEKPDKKNFPQSASFLKELAKKLKIPFNKFLMTIENHANTSSASIPLTLDFAISKKIIKENLIWN